MMEVPKMFMSKIFDKRNKKLWTTMWMSRDDRQSWDVKRPTSKLLLPYMAGSRNISQNIHLVSSSKLQSIHNEVMKWLEVDSVSEEMSISKSCEKRKTWAVSERKRRSVT